jgi:amidase
MGPFVGDVMHGLVMEHAVSRSVRDSAALLDATDGPDTGAPYAAPPKARPFFDEVGVDPGRLRIAFTSTPLAPVPVHPEAVAAVKDAAKLLEQLGHHVEEASFDVPEKHTLMQSFMAIWTAGTAGALLGFSRALGREPSKDELEPLTWALYEMGQKMPLPMYLGAHHMLQAFARAFQAKTDAYDVWLTPTAGEPPPKLGSFEPQGGDPMSPLFRAAPLATFTSPLNVTGQPAASVPLYWTGAGLPLGVQIFARFGDDAVIFRLAGQLERARPWANRRPPVFAA